MNITVRVEGAEEVQQYIRKLGKALDSHKFWRSAFGPLLEVGRRFAVSISPVDSGAYAASHRSAVKGKVGELFVDPLARSAGGGRVIDYAGVIEWREGVYRNTFAPVNRLAVSAVVKEIRNVHK